MIKIGDFTLKTEKAAVQENTYTRWSTRFKQQTYKSPYQFLEDIGKVFVYLMQGDRAICYFYDDIENFGNPNPEYRWVELNNDLAIGKVTVPYKAGVISFKLAIHDKTKNGPINFEQFDAWKKPPPKRLNIMKVRAFIY